MKPQAPFDPQAAVASVETRQPGDDVAVIDELESILAGLTHLLSTAKD